MPTPTPPPLAFDPRVPLLLLLSATTGLVDAASVLGLGRVFTANMTGNVVFLGFAAAGAPGFRWPLFVAAVLSFMAGALIGGRTGKAHVGASERRWLLTSAVIEATLLGLAAVISLRVTIDGAVTAPTMVVIALTGLAMGFRNATVRQMKVADLTTTVLTLTITGLAADSGAAGGGNPNWRRRVAAIAAILIGSMAGAGLYLRFGLAAPLGFAAALVLAGTLACMIHPASDGIVK